jgi:hypothetical protein
METDKQLIQEIPVMEYEDILSPLQKKNGPFPEI